MTLVFFLLTLFQLKHFIADFPLQNSYMLGKFNHQGWILPLLSHAAVHAGLTFAICIAVSQSLILSLILALLDLVSHFCIDRLKASPNYGGQFKPSEPIFWHLLGLDQLAHHLVHYFIIFTLIQH